MKPSAPTDAAALADPLASIGQMLFGLAVVLVILVAFVWLLKRLSSPLRGSGLLRILASTAVGPRERVVLLQTGEKVLMLGVTSSNVRTLHVFEHDEIPPAPPAQTVAAPLPAAAFASRLRQALKSRRHAD